MLRPAMRIRSSRTVVSYLSFSALLLGLAAGTTQTEEPTTKSEPEKSLLVPKRRTNGRNA